MHEICSKLPEYTMLLQHKSGKACSASYQHCTDDAVNQVITFWHGRQRWAAFHKDAHYLVGTGALRILPCVTHLHQHTSVHSQLNSPCNRQFLLKINASCPQQGFPGLFVSGCTRSTSGSCDAIAQLRTVKGAADMEAEIFTWPQ